MLLAGFAIPMAFDRLRGRLVTLVIWGASALLAVSVAPTYHKGFVLPGQAEAKRLVTRSVAGDELRLPPERARYLDRIGSVIRRRIPEDEALFIAPQMPTLYPLLGKTSPVWGLYLVWTADAEEQDEIVRTLERKDVAWALIKDRPIDGKEELRFRNSHPRVWEHLHREFDRVRTPALPRRHLLFRRRSAEGSP
jgi:hypothetical protein